MVKGAGWKGPGVTVIKSFMSQEIDSVLFSLQLPLSLQLLVLLAIKVDAVPKEMTCFLSWVNGSCKARGFLHPP